MWDAERRGVVVVLTYTRPPENVIGFADLAELDEALATWADEDRTQVIMLTGGLPGYFIAHADLADVNALTHGTAAGPYGPQAWEQALRRIAAIPQPVVAAVNGQAWGGGLELALGCLMRVASEVAHFRFPEVAAGAIPGAGGTQRLPRLIGLPQAARLVLGGGLVTAGQALHLGLVDAVLPEQGFLDAALEWAAPFAAQPRHSLFAAKRAIVTGTQLPLDQGLALEQDIFRAVLASSETRAISAGEPAVITRPGAATR
jgi:enoyl-CoA hydratase/carnithine racemase